VSATVFLVLAVMAGIATVVAALMHYSRVDDSIVGPAHRDADTTNTEPTAERTAEAPARRRGSTLLADRLAADAHQLRRGPQRRRLVLVSGTGDGDRRALEMAQAARTSRLARREHRLRALGRRRPLTADEAAALAAARQVLTERGRLVPHEAVPHVTERTDQ
jgi:hypothetical protein